MISLIVLGSRFYVLGAGACHPSRAFSRNAATQETKALASSFAPWKFVRSSHPI